MNERIKELAKRSGFYFYDLHNIDGQDYGETIEADSWNAAEKFAELIIRECGEWVSDNVADGFCEGPRLLKHFGIEE